MAEATTRLAREIERVITAPYVPSLQDLYTLTNNVKPSKIKLWALQKPCQVGLLADVLVDSLSRSRVALPLLSAFATASSFRDALLYRHPATLDTFLQKATDTDESEYNAACVSMLSLPLPSDIVLPGRLASFITKLVTNMAANPSAETVTPLHSLMNLWNDGSSAFLNDISEEVMFNLQLEFTKTLRNMEDHMGILLSLATFARIVSAQQNSGIVRNQCGSETPVWLSNIQHFFGPKRGQKTLDLVALRVILACSSSSGSLSPSQAAESIRLAVSIIDTIDVSQKDAWVASGSSKIAKLCDKVLRDGFDREIQLMGITFLLSLCPIANLPSDIRNLGLRLLVSRDSRAALTTMEPHLVTRLTHSLAAYDESIVYELLRFTVDAVKDNNPNCDSLSNLHVADLLLSSFQQTEFQQVISSLLSSASTKDTIASLFDKFPSKPSPTHCEESEICYYAYATLQNKMLRNLFEMLFAATLSQSGNRREVDIIKSFVGRVPLSLETCAFATSEPSSFRSRLSLRDRRDFLSSQHPSRNWRSQVTDTLRQSSEMVHDRMMKKFEDICVDMERRCYDVEGPLRFVEEDLKKQSFEMQQLQHQNEKLRQDNRQSAQTICDLRQEVARLEEQAESTARRAEELAASLSSAQSCLQEQLSLSDGNLRMEKDKFRTRELDLIASCTEKDDRLEELQGELRCLQAEGEDLRLSLKIEVQTRESSMKTVALLQGELQEHKNLLEQQKSLFTQKEDEVEHLLGSNAEFQMETEHMKTKMDEQNRRIERLHDSLQQAEKTSRSDSEAMRQEYDSHLFSQATEIKNLQEEIAHLNRELQEAATETTKKLQAKDKRMQQLERKVQSMRDEREAKAREFSEAQQHIGRLMGVMGFSAQPAEPKSQQTRSAKNSPETTHQPDVYDDDDDLQLVESFESMSSNLDGPTPKRPRGNRTSQPELVPSRTRGVSTSKSSPQPLESTRRSSRQPLANAGANSPNKTPPTSTLKRQSTIKATDKFEENCLQDLDLDMDLEFSRDFLYTNSTLSDPAPR
ncbi:hypothetical protein N7450_009532 [Penicillium hetheringtonii]|uniref:Uncharacterized protein n=1 Tax=Penicillium hetheringtonii TaxID=911720 RepID=A0AAD6DB36_9EURO|nr:hypothetical protein N7450_009532 [Penicillium hetheringtonii]